MIGSKVSKRYAKALFSLGQEDGKVREYGKDLNAFREFWLQNPEFAGVVASRIFALEDRKRILHKVLDRSGLSQTVKNFLSLLLDKDRIGTIKEMAEHYERLTDEMSNVARAQVVVPRPLKADALGRLEKALRDLTSKEVRTEVREDRGLIGGVVVKIGDLVLDGSIKAQLRGLRESL
ncbi:MAG: ATP synthase F1 subunit delta [Deltaproteobacteria bacterium]|nr:ATP synthase F1 subunit delta [Deltaproteobacteria bacterium]